METRSRQSSRQGGGDAEPVEPRFEPVGGRARRRDIAFFWDFENQTPPNYIDCLLVAQEFRAVGERFADVELGTTERCFVVACNTAKMSETKADSLRELGADTNIDQVHVPNAKKNAVDDKLKKKIDDYV